MKLSLHIFQLNDDVCELNNNDVYGGGGHTSLTV
jgi:hypothetical protein